MNDFARYMLLGEMPWQLRVASGVVSILFGLAAVLWPGLTVSVLLLLFGVYAIVFGIVRLVAMFRAIGEHKTWWTHLIIGAVSVIAGIFVFTYPGVTALFLIYTIAWWALLVGIFEIVAAFAVERFMPVISGLISILFGLVLLANPERGLLALVLVIGVFAIIRGFLDLVASIRAPAQRRAPV